MISFTSLQTRVLRKPEGLHKSVLDCSLSSSETVNHNEREWNKVLLRNTRGSHI